MNTLKAIQTSFPPPNQSFAHGKITASRRQRLILCFCNSKEAGSGSSSPSEGDKRKQELLARIAMLQAQKVRLTDFLDERSAYLTQFAEDATAEFDKIGENALKELDEASSRIMENLENRMQAFEETAEISKQEIEKNERILEDFEDKIERDRNEGLFFKNLREKAPPGKAEAEAKLEGQKIREVTKESAGSKIRRNIYLALMSLLLVTIGNAVLATPEVEWRKVAALGLIFFGLLAQYIYEQSLSSTTEKTDKNKE
ncbi:uncharacterized protein LOC120108854 [Phoenix dactylifera]|uniref:Uncharacterized protein LOC103704061 n=1 Tax=Phoenix dactylifera TaxID=42345 RepID=A0A8B7BU73_PHODC|nr:uncharacterized protein LOC103704061 [Phoenix dactylifera]XP_038978514.1 uncharacterized protein LOC120108854 [Phoenix dactylifera]